MKKVFIVSIALLCPLFSFAQWGVNRHHASGNSNEAQMINYADELAYKRACNDSIYTKEVLQSYLDYKRIRVENIGLEFLTRPIFERVVVKGKKFKEEDKLIWKREFYQFEYEKILKTLRAQAKVASEIQDSIKRHDWSKSHTYVSLKEYCKHDFEIKDTALLHFLDECGVDFKDIYKSYYNKNILPFEYYFIEPGEEESRYSVEDFDRLHKTLLRNKNRSIEEIYGYILRETEYIITNGNIEMPRISRLYQKDKNDENVKELQLLYQQWQNLISDCRWEKYMLSQNEKFKEACSSLRDALDYRNNHPLSNGVYIQDTIDLGSPIPLSFTRHYGSRQIPYKVVGDALIVDGTCILTYVDDQYPTATGDSYKKYTVNLKMLVKVENGVAVSKTISGVQKWWNKDKKVWNRTKGGILDKTEKTLKAKPVVIKTKNVTKAEDLGSGAEITEILSFLRTSYDDDLSIQKLCKEYLKNPHNKHCLSLIKMPIKPVDMSRIR